MSEIDWLKTIAIAAAGGLIVAWATWISKGVAGAMSRNEHRELCEDREKRVAGDLEEIKQMIRDNNRDAVDSRHKISNRVQELALEVAMIGRKPRNDGEPEWLR
jgi:hypothetical protein